MKRKHPTPSRPLLKQLVDVYRRYPCLWDRNDSDYTNKQVRKAAMEKLLMKFHEIDPSGSMKDLKTYLRDLKSSCSRDLDKLLRTSRRDGGGVRLPKTWYFPLLTFLFVQDYPELPQLLESLDLPKPEDVDLRHPKTVLKMLGRQKKKMRTVSKDTMKRCPVTLEKINTKVLKHVLKMYKRLPVLWKTDVDTTTESKLEALSQLLEEYKRAEPDATVNSLSLKLDEFKREYAQELSERLTARGEGQDCEQTWSFKHLTFLTSSVCPPELTHLLRPEDFHYDSGDSESVNSDQNTEDNLLRVEDEYHSDNTEGSCSEDNYKLVYIKQEASGNISEELCIDEDQVPFIKCDELDFNPRKRKLDAGTSQKEEVRDRFSAAAEHFVCKLRHLELEQRVRAEALVEEVLHLAEFNALDQCTSLVVEEPL